MSQRLKVEVKEGTCGIAAGSKEVLNAFKEALPDHEIHSVGCIGMCYQEVLAEVYTADGQRYLYGHLTPATVKNVVDFHQGNGALPKKNLVHIRKEAKDAPTPYLARQTRIALRNIGHINPISLDEAREVGAYEGIEKILREKISPQEVIEQVRTSGIRGRGGAGFSTATKWQFAKDAPGSPKYMICNGDEGDPGAFMDRSLLEGDPHSVVEGLLIAAYAIGASEGYAYIRAEYPLAVANFVQAIEDAKAAGLLGDNILGSDFAFRLKVKQGAGAFVCGEETALIHSIEGERGMPRTRPPFPAIEGVFGKPTIINNVETLSSIPWIIRNGADNYAAYGVENANGTKCFALAGAVAHGGLVEVPMGMTIRELVEDIGGGNLAGKKLKAVQLGGPSGGCIPESLFDTPIEYESIGATGAIMGSGGLIVLDESTCMVDLAKYFLTFTQSESCGKCTFCRLGTLRMKEILTRISEGEGEEKDLETLEELATTIKSSTLCGLGQTAPNPVLTTLRYFKDEYLEHIKEKKCRAGVCKALIRHSIKKENCIACNLCLKACPVSAITGTVKEKGSYSIDASRCIQCGMCHDACRFGAVQVDSGDCKKENA